MNVIEGERKRVQAYEGVVIAKRNRGLNSSFIVRKISSGEGVERTFQTHAPTIASIEVKRSGDVRRAKALLFARSFGQIGTYQGKARLRVHADQGRKERLIVLPSAKQNGTPQACRFSLGET